MSTIKDGPFRESIQFIGNVLREIGPMTGDELRKWIPGPDTRSFYRALNLLLSQGLLLRDDATRIIRLAEPQETTP